MGIAAVGLLHPREFYPCVNVWCVGEAAGNAGKVAVRIDEGKTASAFEGAGDQVVEQS